MDKTRQAGDRPPDQAMVLEQMGAYGVAAYRATNPPPLYLTHLRATGRQRRKVNAELLSPD